MSGKVLMVCLGFADGEPCLETGEFLLDYDPDFNGGLGRAWWTGDASKAVTFESMAAMHEFWRQSSKVKPLRMDGRPNRPLTAYSITNANIDNLQDEGLLAMIRAAKGT